MKVAIIGATGLVGAKIVELLDSDKRVDSMTLVGSQEQLEHPVNYSTPCNYSSLDSFNDPQNYDVIFSAVDSAISHPWVVRHYKNINFFIDKGSEYRMKEGTPLVVPGVSTADIEKQKIIASPNCVAIQLSLALSPIIDFIRDDFMVITSLQSVSGSGKKALEELTMGQSNSSIYPFGINDNILGLCGGEVGTQTDEEIKIEQETSKILNTHLRMEVTSIRVPITRGHHVSVTCFLKDWHHQREDIEHIWRQSKRLKVLPNYKYPSRQHIIDSSNVFISRVRLSQRILSFMVSADNLHVGAAFNAWDIFNTWCDAQQIEKRHGAI